MLTYAREYSFRKKTSVFPYLCGNIWSRPNTDRICSFYVFTQYELLPSPNTKSVASLVKCRVYRILDPLLRVENWIRVKVSASVVSDLQMLNSKKKDRLCLPLRQQRRCSLTIILYWCEFESHWLSSNSNRKQHCN